MVVERRSRQSLCTHLHSAGYVVARGVRLPVENLWTGRRIGGASIERLGEGVLVWAWQESVSATLLRATRYAGSGLFNAKQGALRSAQREGGLSRNLWIFVVRPPQ